MHSKKQHKPSYIKRDLGDWFFYTGGFLLGYFSMILPIFRNNEIIMSAIFPILVGIPFAVAESRDSMGNRIRKHPGLYRVSHKLEMYMGICAFAAGIGAFMGSSEKPCWGWIVVFAASLFLLICKYLPSHGKHRG